MRAQELLRWIDDGSYDRVLKASQCGPRALPIGAAGSCGVCGYQLLGPETFCPGCGRTLAQPQANAAQSSRSMNMTPNQPVRVLCVIANPSDLPHFDSARAWEELAGALQSFIQHGRVILERASDPTEAGLRNAIRQDRFQIVHFVGHAQARAANYTTLALESADGRARQLTATAVGNLVAENKAAKLWVLEACDDAAFCFDAVAQAIAQRGVTAVAAPRLEEHRAARSFRNSTRGCWKA